MLRFSLLVKPHIALLTAFVMDIATNIGKLAIVDMGTIFASPWDDNHRAFIEDTFNFKHVQLDSDILSWKMVMAVLKIVFNPNDFKKLMTDFGVGHGIPFVKQIAWHTPFVWSVFCIWTIQNALDTAKNLLTSAYTLCMAGWIAGPFGKILIICKIAHCVYGVLHWSPEEFAVDVIWTTWMLFTFVLCWVVNLATHPWLQWVTRTLNIMWTAAENVICIAILFVFFNDVVLPYVLKRAMIDLTAVADKQSLTDVEGVQKLMNMQAHKCNLSAIDMVGIIYMNTTHFAVWVI